MKRLNPPFSSNRTGYFVTRAVVSMGFLAAMIFVVARTDSTSRAQGCTTNPVVSNNLDSGAGSLRQAIAEACTGSSITFTMVSVTNPITLTTAELTINKNLIIAGPGSNLLTVARSTAAGTPDFRLIHISGGVTVGISGLTLSNGRISGSFPGNFGGAIWNNHSTLTITDSVISGNSAVQVSPAGFGGGIFNDGSNGGSAALTILNSQITDNNTVGNGGGIFNFGFNGSATLTITNSTISNNSAQSGGGGILSTGQKGSAPVQIMHSAITGNNAQNGGGINMDGTQNGSTPLIIANSTISGNKATVTGGGLVTQGTTNSSGAPVTIVNATITDNRCDSDNTNTSSACGGAYFIWTGPVTVHNSIIARNFNGGTTADDIPNNSLDPASSFNLIGTGGAGGLVNGVNNNLVNVADPLLGPLANNGGPTQTHKLLAGSPALDAGTNCVVDNSCSPALGFSLTTDQRGAGFSRSADSADAGTTKTVDIGSFEARASVEDISDKSTLEETFLFFGFNVGDATAITNVSASSNNTALVPNANLSVSGSGSSRTLNITPALNQTGTTTITVTVTSGTESTSDSFVLTVTPVNDAPSDIALTNSNVADNSPSNTLVGTFTSLDPDQLQTFTYSLVSGTGSVDNASFSINGDQLRTSSTFDFETKSTFTIRVRSTDGGGLFVEKQFIVNIVDGPDNPGAVAFSSSSFSVGEGDGNANVKLTRTGGVDNPVFARLDIADVTTSPADYLFAPGSLDTSFNAGTGATSGSSALSQTVQEVLLQPDGKIVIGGAFLFYNDVSRNRLARINSDGSLDTTFNPGAGPNTVVLCMALQADGKILIGGNFASYDGTPRSRIARLNSDGTLDLSFFAVLPNDVVRAIVVQPDGKILIGGDFSFVNGSSRNHVARLNDNGTLDSSFIPPSGSNGVVGAVTLQPDGKILVGGGFISFSTANNTRLVRLTSSGALDATFNSALGISMAPRQMVLQPDGKILVGGEWVGSDTPFGKQGVARLENNGAADGTFDPGLGTNGHAVDALALQPDSKIVIVGTFPTFAGTTVNRIARLTTGGSVDSSFNAGTGLNSSGFAVALQPDGKIVLGGLYTFYNDVSSNGITRINGDLFVMWPAGDSTDKSVSLPIVNDALDEPNETLSLTVIPVSGGATAGVPSTATLTILDNDPSPTAISAVSGSGAFGGTATLTATLTSGSTGISGQTVSFTLNGSNVGSATTNSSGVATLSGVSLSGINTGTHPNAVGASFAGDATNFLGSSGTGPLTVSQTTTATALSSSGNPSEFGQSVTFTATVTGSGGTPTGTVQFKDGAVNLGEAQAMTAGVAQLTISSLTSGTHSITADYSGDANFLVSTGTLAGGQVVKPQPTLLIDDVLVTEGNSGTTNLVFTVSLSATNALTVNVNFATANGTATTSDNDYQSANGTLTFNSGDLTKTITVVVTGDQTFEADETVLVNLTTPVNVVIADALGVGTILNDDNLQLILDESGPAADQAAALDSFLFTRDPFKVLSIADWYDFGGSVDRNTRVLIFATNLTLNQGELPASVVVNLVDGNSQTHNVLAEDVRALPNTDFTQVLFRLPNSLAPGVCHVTIKAQGRSSNTGTIRIAP